MSRTARGAALAAALVGLQVLALLGIGSLPHVRRAASAPAATTRSHRTDHLEQMVLVQTTVLAARRAKLAEDAAADAGRRDDDRASRGVARGLLGRFTVTCYALNGTTASGHQVSRDVVAVDPRVIPIGTRVHIGGVGPRVALDTGRKIKGHRLDIWLPSESACMRFGRKSLTVYLA